MPILLSILTLKTVHNNVMCEIMWKIINIITQLIESVCVYINYIAALVYIMEFLDWAWCEWFKIIIPVRTTEFGFL